jgi:hypothetical protein
MTQDRIKQRAEELKVIYMNAGVDPISRWEIRISLGGLADFYRIYDKATKEIKELEVNEENW